MIWLIGVLLAALGITKGADAAETVTDFVEEHMDSWTQYDALFKRYAQIYGVEDWHWLKAIALNESSLGKAKSVARGFEAPWDIEGSKSYDGKSWGLMQVTMAIYKHSGVLFTFATPTYGLNTTTEHIFTRSVP